MTDIGWRCDTCNEWYAHSFKSCPDCQYAPKPRKKQTKKKTTKPTPKLTKTTRELTIPIMKHGVLIDYIRENKKGKILSYFYDGHWHSILELWFYVEWQKTGLLMPTPEYRFHPTRQWKLDFAWQDSKVAVEMEGGIFSRGRHTRGAGYKKDIEKYNEATRLGWQVYRFADMEVGNIDFMKTVFENIEEKAA